MSYSIVPLLRANPEVGRHWEPGSCHRTTIRGTFPPGKTGLTVAMSMTEKQGGSDLRRNETCAERTGVPNEYILRGHKFFCSGRWATRSVHGAHHVGRVAFPWRHACCQTAATTASISRG